jgi:hypothetical protein
MQQRNITSYNIRTRLLQHQIHLAATWKRCLHENVLTLLLALYCCLCPMASEGERGIGMFGYKGLETSELILVPSSPCLPNTMELFGTFGPKGQPMPLNYYPHTHPKSIE